MRSIYSGCALIKKEAGSKAVSVRKNPTPYTKGNAVGIIWRKSAN